MSKIISSIIVIAILVFIVSAIINKSEKENIKDSEKTENTEIVEKLSTSTDPINTIPIPQITIADGKYSIKPSDISIKWLGRKIVLKDFTEKGSVMAKEANFEVINNKVISNVFIIDMTSILNAKAKAGDKQDRLTAHLKSADFFDAEKFPTATFIAKEFIASTTDVFTLNGDLTVKGITNKISIPITLDRKDTKFIKAKGSVELDRTLWDIRYGSDKFFDNLGDKIIDDMFNINLEIKINTSIPKTEIESI